MLSRYASLKQGLVGAWCPSVSGSFGFRLPDLSGRGNAGTLTNMDPGTDWVPSGGKLALDFDGVNDCVDLGTSAHLASLQVPLTITAWVYKTTGTNGAVFSQYRNITLNRLIKLAAYGTTEFAYYASKSDGTYQRVAYSLVPTTSRWNFLSWVVDGSILSPTCRLGFDGLEETFTLAALSSTPDVTVPIRLASTFYNGANSEFFAGQIDDVRIYNRALTPSEIRLLYTGGRGVGLLPERIKHRRKTTAAATNRRRRLICGANC